MLKVARHTTADGRRSALLAAILYISTELERMGDYARKGIARITLMLGLSRMVKPTPEIQVMADRGTDMACRALDAFVNRDWKRQRRSARDDEIDAMYNKVNRELVTTMMAHLTVSDQATICPGRRITCASPTV